MKEQQDLKLTFKNKIEQFTKVHVKSDHDFKDLKIKNQKLNIEYEELVNYKWENQEENGVGEVEVVPEKRQYEEREI